ncbi:MAG: sulfite exporter TauE/SafE family protein [Nitrospiraceae bacterium]
MPDTQLLTVLSLGLLLGARHALDVDHVAAVTTILSERPDFRLSGLIGVSWGFGHTVMLLLVGVAVLVFKIAIPERVASGLELLVGLMLVGLGASLALTLWRGRWHLHAHEHEGATHQHLHSHRLDTGHAHTHWLRVTLKPFAVGMVHGLAGSAGLALMVLASVRSVWQGVAYLLVFGVGSILGMAGLGALISLPLVGSASLGRPAQLTLQGLASVGSIGLGLSMMARVGLG